MADPRGSAISCKGKPKMTSQPLRIGSDHYHLSNGSLQTERLFPCVILLCRIDFFFSRRVYKQHLPFLKLCPASQHHQTFETVQTPSQLLSIKFLFRCYSLFLTRTKQHRSHALSKPRASCSCTCIRFCLSNQDRKARLRSRC